MPRVLTPKQEHFCQAYIESNNATEAYRRSYSTSAMKKSTIHRTAHELMQNSKVAARIGDLQEEGRKRHDITVDSLTEQLQDAYGLAMQTGHAAAAVGATWALAKLHGLDKSALKSSRELYPDIEIRITRDPKPM